MEKEQSAKNAQTATEKVRKNVSHVAVLGKHENPGAPLIAIYIIQINNLSRLVFQLELGRQP
jgi:hypothetical protein